MEPRTVTSQARSRKCSSCLHDTSSPEHGEKKTCYGRCAGGQMTVAVWVPM